MFMNRNGYWMSPAFRTMFAPDGGDGAGAAGDGGSPGGDGTNAAGGAEISGNGVDQAGDAGSTGENKGEDLNAQIARLQAEMAKQKAALDKATKEAGDARKALKAKMTQEEIDAASKQEAEEKAAKELDELRREVAKGKTVKSVMGKLGIDEESAGNLADALYGAADIENALLGIQKAWQIREASLKKEYGRITGPGAGADSNSPEAMAVRRAAEIGKQTNAVKEQAQKAMSAYMR